jgi:hypothetical protein
MPSINNLLSAISERTIAQRIAIPHDEARIGFALRSNTVKDFDDFSRIIGEYYTYHFTRCVAQGGTMSAAEASGRAKEILDHEYHRMNGDINTAFNDAHDGTNGGLRSILDRIADALKAESIERYMRDVFDREVAPNSWEGKVEIIRQFFERCGMDLSSSVQTDQPERYAQNYKDLIRTYVQALQRSSSIFRRF